MLLRDRPYSVIKSLVGLALWLTEIALFSCVSIQTKVLRPESNPSHYKIELSGKKGIIVFEVSGWSDATGHADLWDGAGCVGSDCGERASKILFWETF